MRTAFNSIFMPGSGANRISEFFGSGRQSQITLRADGKIGYMPSSPAITKLTFFRLALLQTITRRNSYTLRQRQAWGQVAFNNGWSFTGGQMWTLLTENRKGIDNLSTARPMTIDPNYNVGFSFARQYGVRVVKNLNNRFWLAASLENPQTTFTATNANTISPWAVTVWAPDSTIPASLLAHHHRQQPHRRRQPHLHSPLAPMHPTIPSTPCLTLSSRRPLNPVSDTMKSSASSVGSATGFIPARKRRTIRHLRYLPLPRGVHNYSRNGGGVGGNARVSVPTSTWTSAFTAFMGMA